MTLTKPCANLLIDILESTAALCAASILYRSRADGWSQLTALACPACYEDLHTFKEPFSTRKLQFSAPQGSLWHPWSPVWWPRAHHGHAQGGQHEKDQFFELFDPPMRAPSLLQFRVKRRKRQKTRAFLGDLQRTPIAWRKYLKNGPARTLKMCLKHTKYAVRCKVAFLQRKA